MYQITTEQIKALASISNSTEVWLKHAFPTAFSTIMDRVKSVEDADTETFGSNKELEPHIMRCQAFKSASLVHTALCEGWVFDTSPPAYRPALQVGDNKYLFPFWFETEEKRDYFQTQFADLLKTIITGTL